MKSYHFCVYIIINRFKNKAFVEDVSNVSIVFGHLFRIKEFIISGVSETEKEFFLSCWLQEREKTKADE